MDSTWNYITDPKTKIKYSIKSPEGQKLLQIYFSNSEQVGGAAYLRTAMSAVNGAIESAQRGMSVVGSRAVSAIGTTGKAAWAATTFVSDAFITATTGTITDLGQKLNELLPGFSDDINRLDKKEAFLEKLHEKPFKITLSLDPKWAPLYTYEPVDNSQELEGGFVVESRQVDRKKRNTTKKFTDPVTAVAAQIGARLARSGRNQEHEEDYPGIGRVGGIVDHLILIDPEPEQRSGHAPSRILGTLIFNGQILPNLDDFARALRRAPRFHGAPIPDKDDLVLKYKITVMDQVTSASVGTEKLLELRKVGCSLWQADSYLNLIGKRGPGLEPVTEKDVLTIVGEEVTTSASPLLEKNYTNEYKGESIIGTAAVKDSPPMRDINDRLLGLKEKFIKHSDLDKLILIRPVGDGWRLISGPSEDDAILYLNVAMAIIAQDVDETDPHRNLQEAFRGLEDGGKKSLDEITTLITHFVYASVAQVVLLDLKQISHKIDTHILEVAVNIYKVTQRLAKLDVTKRVRELDVTPNTIKLVETLNTKVSNETAEVVATEAETVMPPVGEQVKMRSIPEADAVATNEEITAMRVDGHTGEHSHRMGIYALNRIYSPKNGANVYSLVTGKENVHMYRAVNGKFCISNTKNMVAGAFLGWIKSTTPSVTPTNIVWGVSNGTILVTDPLLTVTKMSAVDIDPAKVEAGEGNVISSTWNWLTGQSGGTLDTVTVEEVLAIMTPVSVELARAATENFTVEGLRAVRLREDEEETIEIPTGNTNHFPIYLRKVPPTSGVRGQKYEIVWNNSKNHISASVLISHLNFMIEQTFNYINTRGGTRMAVHEIKPFIDAALEHAYSHNFFENAQVKLEKLKEKMNGWRIINIDKGTTATITVPAAINQSSGITGVRYLRYICHGCSSENAITITGKEDPESQKKRTNAAANLDMVENMMIFQKETQGGTIQEWQMRSDGFAPGKAHTLHSANLGSSGQWHDNWEEATRRNTEERPTSSEEPEGVEIRNLVFPIHLIGSKSHSNTCCGDYLIYDPNEHSLEIQVSGDGALFSSDDIVFEYWWTTNSLPQLPPGFAE